MNLTNVSTTAIAVATYIVIGGFFAQSGVILNAAAADFRAPVPETATLFSYLVGGSLVGLIACLFIFNVFSIRQALFGAYLTLFVGVALLAVTRALPMGALAVGLCGFGAGVGLSTGAVIIAKTFVGRPRVLGFLSTDCAFSLAGYVFPPFAANAIARGWPWQSGYIAVACVAALLLVGAAFVRFPVTGRTAMPQKRSMPQTTTARSRSVIALFALGLGLYLCGQGAFLIWAPNDLEATFVLPAQKAAGIIGTFWGPSVFGLITTALLVTRVPARRVLVGAAGITVGTLVAATTAHDAHTFFTATLVFGFTSTCLFKLMISIGTDQVAGASPQLVTLLILSSTVGSTLAPAISAPIVGIYGAHAGVVMALVCYAGTLAAVVAGIIVERGGRSAAALFPIATEGA